eukprot:TRINITY_DN1436_c0_g1_i1.p1 TRINITY_DN1436_c0_g1~~TRINITY_DN1436_c0_g1_i1.p1  ORF type:complete len:523 (+),score=136.53 TRINITY_DN1436_c0_g1_i1:61-1629(+)
MSESVSNLSSIENHFQNNSKRKMIDFDSLKFNSFNLNDVDNLFEGMNTPAIVVSKTAKKRVLNENYDLSSTKNNRKIKTHVVNDQMLREIEASNGYVDLLINQDRLFEDILTKTELGSKNEKKKSNTNKLNQSIQTKLSNTHKTSQNKMFNHLRTNDFEKLRKIQSEKLENLNENYRSELRSLKESINGASVKMSDLADSNREFESEKEQLLYTKSLLKEKLRRQHLRLVDQERRLRIFEQTKPIFSKLKEKFNFKDPKEVITRLEDLESSHRESYSKLLEITAKYNKLQKEYSDLKSDFDIQNHREILDMTRKWQENEELKQDLERNVQNQRLVIDRFKDEQSKSRDMYFGLIDRWSQWKDKIEQWSDSSITTTNNINKLDLSDPLMVLDSLNLMINSASPTKAGILVREFSGTCNMLWSRFLRDHPSIRGKPIKILQIFIQKFDEQSKMVSKRIEELSLKENALKELQEENDKLNGILKMYEEKENEKKSLYDNRNTDTFGNISNKPSATFMMTPRNLNL